MRRSKIVLFVHLVWTTWDRLPLIRPAFEQRLYRFLVAEGRRQGCTVVAINGMPDHVHVLIQIPSTIPVAKLVNQLKGTSSWWVNHHGLAEIQFKWRGSYGAFTVSRWDVDKVAHYIKRQKEHHGTANLIHDLEATDEERREPISNYGTSCVHSVDQC